MPILRALDKFMHWLVHGFFWLLSNFWFRLFHARKVYGEENIPREGGFIAMSNHASYYDPPLIGGATAVRWFRYMARSTLFTPLTGWLLHWMGAFPVKRGAVDRNAWGKLIEIVQSGWPVVFFPEGTRTPDGEIKQGKPGAGMLVYSARTKVLPVYLHGTYEAWQKGRKAPKLFTPITVIFGEPLTFEEFYGREGNKELYVEMTDKVMNAIKKLRDDCLAGAYTGKK